MKKIISIVWAMAISLSLFSATPIYAVNDSLDSVEKEVELLRYSYASSVSSMLTISSGTATCTSVATGNSSVVEINATQYLEKKSGNNWTAVSGGTWTNSSNGNFFTTTNTKSGLSSGTYRVKTVFTVYTSSNSEEIEKISKEKTI